LRTKIDYMIKRITIVLLTLILSSHLYGQEFKEKSYFKFRDFGQYFLADRYAPIVNLGLGWMIVQPSYDIDPEHRRVVPVAEPILGAQLPIYYYADETRRWSVSIPVSFSVWFDYTEARTAPILNTDYRFAAMELNYSQKLNHSWIKNIGFKFIPFFHESTHVGDELLLDKVLDSIPMARINVSYETFELAVQINDPYDQKIKNHSGRLGAKFLWNPSKGYYTSDSLERSPNVEIKPSKRWIEPYLQYQYQNPDGWLSNDKMMFVFSTDLSLRVRYDYPFRFRNKEGEIETHHAGEAYQLCTNSLFGWKFINAKEEVSDVGAFFKFYWGINPHGQFRNIPRYPWFGINIVYDI